MLAGFQGDHDQATALAQAALELAETRGDAFGTARGHFMLSFAAGGRGDRDEAIARAERSLAGFRSLGDEARIGSALNRLGIETYQAGEVERADGLFQEALTRWRTVGHVWGIATALANLALLARDRGDPERAAAHYRESLELCRQQGDQWGLVEVVAGLADVAVTRGRATLAARLFGAADALGEAIGLRLQPYVRAHHDRALAATRTALGADDFAAAWDAGRALPPARAMAEARTVDATRAAPERADRPHARPASDQDAPKAADALGLTPRELEVLRLVAAGRSSREIACALFISHRTATTHVANILGKLGVDSRAAAVARAYRDGLV